jgi:SpoVK/Ycf46/Vps4 family AAA+-type ATPase
VLLLDEVDKMMEIRRLPQMGVAMERFLDFLEKQKDAFLVVTANDLENVPREFTRNGRLDGTFTVDLPTLKERRSVIRSLANRYHWKQIKLFERDVETLAEASAGYTPADIKTAIKNAQFIALADGKRPAEVKDVVRALGKLTPLSASMEQWELEELRKELKKRGQPVSDEQPEAIGPVRLGPGFHVNR